MEGPLTILVFFGVIVVTALIFGVWVVVSIVRGVFRGIMALVRTKPRLRFDPLALRGRVCHHERCRAVNPGQARFCRRCGRELPAATRVSIRRAAML
jgi:hypothetical protein